MASGHITSWEIDGEKMEIVTDFILGGSKITADGDCSHEIKRRLLLGRKAITKADSVLKSINFSALSFLYNPTLTSIYDHWKNHSLDYYY